MKVASNGRRVCSINILCEQRVSTCICITNMSVIRVAIIAETVQVLDAAVSAMSRIADLSFGVIMRRTERVLAVVLPEHTIHRNGRPVGTGTRPVGMIADKGAVVQYTLTDKPAAALAGGVAAEDAVNDRRGSIINGNTTTVLRGVSAEGAILDRDVVTLSVDVNTAAISGAITVAMKLQLKSKGRAYWILMPR